MTIISWLEIIVIIVMILGFKFVPDYNILGTPAYALINISKLSLRLKTVK